MPLALDPTATFRVSLASDQDKPDTERPVFIYRYLTGRQWRQIARRQDSLDTAEGADKVVDLTYESAAAGLVGWENMNGPDGPIEFDPAKLEDVVGLIEAQELIAKLLTQRPDLDDKKKCALPSDSNTEESAKAAPASSDAPTDPAPPSP